MRWYVIAVLAVAALVVAGCGKPVETTHGQEVESAEHEHGEEVEGEHHEEGPEGEHEESGQVEVAEYFCPMAACNVTSDAPGRCPKCGMALQMRKEAHEEESGPAEVTEYFCPMAACAVTSDEPGRCPKCGMALQMRKVAVSAAGQGTHGDEEHGE